jgi:type II secretory ATPase GspE/PulE/Tfp pilus assembly ATPase PilB-like protein
VFEVSEAVQQLILKRATSSEIQAQAESEGMVTMRADGFLKTLAGQTTVQEVNRVASADSA